MGSRKVYFAANFTQCERLRSIARMVEAHGHKVTSRWLYEDVKATFLTGDGKDHRFHADRDLFDLLSSDTFVYFNSAAGSNRGARHVEFGFALAIQYPIVVFGDKENVFHYLPTVDHVITDWQLLDWLKDLN